MRWKVGTKFRFRNNYNNETYQNPIVTKIQKGTYDTVEIWFSYEKNREGHVYLGLPTIDDESQNNIWYGIIVGGNRKEFTDEEYEELLV